MCPCAADILPVILKAADEGVTDPKQKCSAEWPMTGNNLATRGHDLKTFKILYIIMRLRGRELIKIKSNVRDSEYHTILEALNYEGVFSVSKNKDGEFEIMEECDRYFSITITKDQMLMLINELTRLIE
jgi:phosphoribosylformylglycinamidine (FGAM) synthase PurS component